MNTSKTLLSLYLVCGNIGSVFRPHFFQRAGLAIERHSLPWFYVSVLICLVI